MRCALLVASLLLGGCYRSYTLAGEIDAGPSTCGDGVVQGAEQCDGNVGACTGGSSCPGFRMCRDDCTWTDCLDGGFGVLAGPAPLPPESDPPGKVTRTATTWTGSRYGVVFSGTRPFTSGPWSSLFTTLYTVADVDVPAHPILPDVYAISEAHMQWMPEQNVFGIAMIAGGGVTQGLLNIADPYGWVLIDPGVALPGGPAADPFIATSSRGYGVAWVAGSGTRQLWFADYSGDMDELDRFNLTGDSSVLINWLPRVLAHDEDYTVIWHADDIGGTNRSFLMMQTLPHGPPPVIDPLVLFDDRQVVPPFGADFTGDDIHLVFSVQPTFDAQVLDLYLASVRTSGAVVLEPVLVGTVKRAMFRDVDMAWSGSELGIVAASPVGDNVMAPRNLVFVRAAPDGTLIGAPLPITTSGDASVPSVVWDGDAWGVTYALVTEDSPATSLVELVRVGCIPPD